MTSFGIPERERRSPRISCDRQVFEQVVKLKKMTATPGQYKQNDGSPFPDQDWEKLAGHALPEKSKTLASFVDAWAVTQQISSPSTTREDIAIALELVAKKLRS